MNKLFVVVVLLISGLLHAQNYYVVSIEGEIFDGTTALAPKHKLTPETQLRFATETASARVISPKKGYFVLSAANAKKAGRSEFFVAVKHALIPPSQLKETGIRGSSSAIVKLEDPYDLLDYFRGDVAYPDTLVFNLDPDEFEEKDGYFELTAMWGKETTTYRYPALNNTLSLHLPPGHLENPADAYTFSYQPLFNEEPDDFTPEPFQFHPVPVADLRTELAYLRELLPEYTASDFLQNVALPHVESQFGRISSGWVLALLAEEK
ncbi:MAG: hypothetical protein AB8H12_14340 [Lewinella sp.]